MSGRMIDPVHRDERTIYPDGSSAGSNGRSGEFDNYDDFDFVHGLFPAAHQEFVSMLHRNPYALPDPSKRAFGH